MPLPERHNDVREAGACVLLTKRRFESNKPPAQSVAASERGVTLVVYRTELESVRSKVRTDPLDVAAQSHECLFECGAVSGGCGIERFQPGMRESNPLNVGGAACEPKIRNVQAEGHVERASVIARAAEVTRRIPLSAF